MERRSPAGFSPLPRRTRALLPPPTNMRRAVSALRDTVSDVNWFTFDGTTSTDIDDAGVLAGFDANSILIEGDWVA